MNKPKLIHNIDDKQWRKFVGIAKYNSMKVGQLLNELIYIYLERHKIKKEVDKDEHNTIR